MNKMKIDKQHYLNRKSAWSITTSLIIVISAISLFYVAGYAYAALFTDAFKIRSENNEHYIDFSVSNAIGNGNRTFISILTAIILICAIICIHARAGRLSLVRTVSFAIISGLLVAIVYINPLILSLDDKTRKKYSTPHFVLASIAFSISAFYIALTYFSLYKSMKKGKTKKSKLTMAVMIILVVVNTLSLIGCFASKMIEKQTTKQLQWGVSGELSKSFAVFENLQILSLITTFVFLGFYG